MKGFSMYEQAQRYAAQSASVEDFGCVSNIVRAHFDDHETFRFSAQVPCLEYISLLIENALLLRTNRAGRVYAGFEKLSRMEPVAERYLRIADLSERVYVFGEADWQPPRHPNMRSVVISSGSPLNQEWFVIADSPSLRVALVARDEDGFQTPVLDERRFHAFKTSDPAFVARLSDAAEDLIDDLLAA